MELSGYTIGKRQTVDVIDHPEHGRCRAVYGNGPSVLLFDDGRALTCRVIGRGWSKDAGSRLDLAASGTGERIKCPLVEVGASHRRSWSARLGEGWLVDLPGGLGQRFEGDDGRETVFSWRRAECIDAPAKRGLTKAQREKLPSTDEDHRWWRYEMADGEALVFRHGGAPPAEVLDAPPVDAKGKRAAKPQPSLPGMKP